MKNNKGITIVEVMGMMVIVVVLLGTVGLGIAGLGNKEVHTAIVTEKESIRSGDGNKYLIFTDGEVFQNTDNIFVGKWNSSDFYRDLKVEHKYEFNTIGFRIPFLSRYKNIVSFREVE